MDGSMGDFTFNGWGQAVPPDASQVPTPPAPETYGSNLQNSSPAFMPTFMKALEMITGVFPSLCIEAKNTTLVDSLFRNRPFRESVFKMLLMASSSAAELIDRHSNPRAYGAVRFIRNVLALEKLRRHIMTNFVVHGGTNLDDWGNICHQVTNSQPFPGSPESSGIDYVPPGLTRAGTFIIGIGCNVVHPSTLYALCRFAASGDSTEVSVKASPFNLSWSPRPSRFRVESLYRYGPGIQIVPDDDGPMKFIMSKPAERFSWLQVLRFSEIRADGTLEEPCYIVMYLPSTPQPADKPDGELKDTNFMQFMLIDTAKGVTEMSMLDAYMERRRASTLPMAIALLKKMKFSMFDPENSVIGVAPSIGGMSGSRFFPRITTFSGPAAVHVLPEYDTIRDALGKCLEKGRNRGYAFVGAPGTGKTIMMNQLVNEFPSAPVVKFSMQGFQSVQPGQTPLLQAIVDVVQSLVDAGFDKVFLCCDDIDSVDMSEKNGSVESLINLLDGLHGRMPESTSVVFMCTVNDPTKMHSAIIKRGKRIDEVIEVPCPDAGTIRRLINSLKDRNDPTDYTGMEFGKAIERMADDRFSLADLSTMMSNLQIYGSPDESGKFSPETLETAIGRIEHSKENAGKTYGA